MRSFERDTQRWEIELVETSIVSRRYQDDVLIETETVERKSPIAAKWELDRQCHARCAEGFKISEGSRDAVEPQSSHTQLEAALLADPDDLPAHLVYADYLSERGDEWGQLISLQCARDQLPRFGASEARDEFARIEAELMFRHSAQLWGRLGETLVDAHTQVYACDLIAATWRWGFVREAVIKSWANPILDFEEAIAELAELRITRLLQRLELRGEAWTPEQLQRLAHATWPDLRELEISNEHGFHGAAEAFDPLPLEALLDGERAPRLTKLRLIGSIATDAYCPLLVSCALSDQLTSIRLERGSFSAAAIDAFADAHARGWLPALEELVLTGVGLPDDAHERLTGVAAKLRIDARET